MSWLCPRRHRGPDAVTLIPRSIPLIALCTGENLSTGDPCGQRQLPIVSADKGGHMWGNPDAIDRLAARCDVAAEQIDAVANRGQRAGRAVPWESTAGNAFQQRVDEFQGDTIRCIGEFHDAAAALRSHAATCRARIEEIRRLERLALEALAAAAHAAAEATKAAEQAAVSVLDSGKHVVAGALHAIRRIL